MTPFETQRDQVADWLETALANQLQPGAITGPGIVPERLLAAMRHGALNGGKRLRPLLVVQAAEVFGVPREKTVCAALAIEMVHCYSLIHDDLPAMDDDDLRRGQPTVHKAFDDATAILAGDALLTLAFETLTAADVAADIRAELVTELARGAGAAGMAGGQMRDLEGENLPLDQDEIARMQAMKTGALIRAAVRMGAILGGADQAQLDAVTRYGEMAGRAFQLADDILDVTASTEQLGKATQKDARHNKPTLVSRIGLEATQRLLGDSIHHAISALTMFGPEADPLRATARYFAERQN